MSKMMFCIYFRQLRPLKRVMIYFLYMGQEPAKKAIGRRGRKGKGKGKRQQRAQQQDDTPSFNLTFRPECFNILPSSFFSSDTLRHIKFLTSSIIQQNNYVLAISKSPFKYGPPFPAFENNHTFWSSQDSAPLVKAMNKIRRLRFLIRIFLHKWRASRLRSVNTDDVATLEPPKKPIAVVDWTRRTKYIYEAATLMRDITGRLMNHDGFFDTPQEIRNPLTNNPLTQAQILSVWNQLSYAGIPVSTAFAAFRQCRWNLDKFTVEYTKNLQLHAFRKTMLDTRHGDCKERLLDFIEYAHDQEDYPCNGFSYKYILNKFPDHEIIKMWASLCTRYYEASIIYQNRDMALRIQDAVIEETSKILYRQEDILQLYNSHRRYVSAQAVIQIVGEH